MSAEVLENMKRLNKEASAATAWKQIGRAAAGGKHKVTEGIHEGVSKITKKPRSDKSLAKGFEREKKLTEMDKAIDASKDADILARMEKIKKFVAKDRARTAAQNSTIPGKHLNKAERVAKKKALKDLKQGFIDSLLSDPTTGNARNKIWKSIDPKSKLLRNPISDKQYTKGIDAIQKKQKEAIALLKSKGYSATEADELVKKWTKGWTGTPGGSRLKSSAAVGTALSVPTIYGANKLRSGGDDDIVAESGDAVKHTADQALEKGKDIFTGTTKKERDASTDVDNIAQPGELNISEKPEQGPSLLEHVKELLGTQAGHAGVGALAGGAGAYGLQKLLQGDKRLTAEEERALKKKQALITALASLAGGGIGAGAHYYRNKQASDERTQLVGQLQTDAQEMTDEELEHRIANIKRNRMMTKQASEEKIAIKAQLTTARKLGII